MPDHVNSTRTFINRRLSNVRAGLVRSRRNVMSMFHKQHSDEIELSGGKLETLLRPMYYKLYTTGVITTE